MKTLSKGLNGLVAIWAAVGLTLLCGQARAETQSLDPAGLCSRAVQAAEQRYALPHGLLFAISQVESGRPNAATHRLEPWPWTVQAQGESRYFASKEEAVAWVQAAQAKGIVSIDTGCMQVNLFYHPQAFKDAGAAFDPDNNADYAARFLVSLHASTGDWQQAAGFYHSQTLALAVPYRQRVENALNGKALGGRGYPALPPAPPTRLALLQQAWDATLDGSDAAPSAAPASDWTVLLQARPQPPLRRRRPHGEVLLSFAH